MTTPSLTDLFGTTEPQPQRRVLRAGDLTAVLEGGNLRDIRFAGVEVLRAINYLARDTGWGTYAPLITDLVVTQTPTRFDVTYGASCVGPQGQFDYTMIITGGADGRVRMLVTGRAITDFPTNRTGFVLLHPAEVAGLPLHIDCDGGGLDMTFPRAIHPGAPATGITAMTHEPAPGLIARVQMTGDTFEMEDQRNWADASFKTYIRPLSKPRPYVIGKGVQDVQSVTLTLSGRVVATSVASANTAKLVIGRVDGVMPAMALFADRPEALAGDPAGLKGAAQYLILRWQPGHDLSAGRDFALALGAVPIVEAIFPATAPKSEVADLLAALSHAELKISVLLIAPERERRTSPAGHLPPGEVTVDTLVNALRAAEFTGRIVAGTPSFFPEFNRNPPGSLADAVYFGGCGIVHAADDLSVMETISVYPAILSSAAVLSGGRPIWLGPCTIGARHAPYGPAVVPNPGNRRIPMAGSDPRHAALFGAAYAVGLAAGCAGVECLTPAAPFGPFGLFKADGSPAPLMAVQKVLAGAAGATRHSVDAPGLAAVAWADQLGVCILAANMGATSVALNLPQGATVKMLLADATWSTAASRPLPLGPYRTALITVPT